MLGDEPRSPGPLVRVSKTFDQASMRCPVEGMQPPSGQDPEELEWTRF
jgi:hypothetical protein